MRMESNHTPGTFWQLRLAVQRGLTCKLFALYYRIEGVKSRLEVSLATLTDSDTQPTTACQVALDEQQLTFAENASSTAVPSPAAGTRQPCYKF
jgi:hypothetical protein